MDYKMRVFEASMQLRDLKVGDIVTPQHMSAIDVFVGPLLQAARKLEPKEMVIDFMSGKPVVTKNEIGVGVEITETSE